MAARFQAQTNCGELSGGMNLPSQPAVGSVSTDANGHMEDIFANGNAFWPSAQIALPSARGSRLAWVTGTISVALHASIALAILYVPFSETGRSSIPSDAVSLEISIPSFVQQSTATSVDEPSATVSAISPDEGDVDTLAAADASEPTVTKPATETAPSIISGSAPEADFTANNSRVIALKAEPLDVEETEQKREDTKAIANPRVRKESKRPSKAKDHSDVSVKQPNKGKQAATQKKGGKTSTGTSKSGNGGRAAASAGSIAGYAAQVRARVFRNRPSTAGGRGVASVSFAVSRSGGLSYVRLSRSSGNASLDQAALSAVRRAAPFPPPPGGTAPRFNIPFAFR